MDLETLQMPICCASFHCFANKNTPSGSNLLHSLLCCIVAGRWEALLWILKQLQLEPCKAYTASPVVNVEGDICCLLGILLTLILHLLALLSLFSACISFLSLCCLLLLLWNPSRLCEPSIHHQIWKNFCNFMLLALYHCLLLFSTNSEP